VKPVRHRFIFNNQKKLSPDYLGGSFSACFSKRSICILLHDFTFIVCSAGLADSVRHHQCAAFAALD
jgi:hypothetical protein